MHPATPSTSSQPLVLRRVAPLPTPWSIVTVAGLSIVVGIAGWVASDRVGYRMRA